MISTNQFILKTLHSASDTQISEKVRKAVVACDANDNSKIVELFRWIYSLNVTDRSDFIAEFVNPEFTTSKSYGADETTCTSKAA